MLHLILNSPFQSQALAQALSYLQPEDELVLMQDAVIAASAPQWSEQLADIPLYVMQEDLQARGLHHRVGNVLDMAGLVALIAQKGSPRTWGG
ncbi:sulfurtransferase complex subunit TusB [Aeromonas allosaccharophila]|jgi:tRNA 2-thiouridine synthesizing protein B|uniref:Sulfurtransferase complex subunit TusB n=1 Tax=Aeromonas allosaccharophila TaxID=656 RepID=A0A7T2PEI7_9GAMM|nr:sulfurtransferase complex subunit TusB [Aeromonas allosaccharophila]MCE9954312.1 sulfurtransferase complex subunit TusB [Aeromonas allosaccharophila]QPR54192.1 sulfurtransferase complex subunit TusB [Aeromonas allosaccharophila]WED76453.1 sulfurtransferase complex subunit TusB [Aeromonas allosaccharophila]